MNEPDWSLLPNHPRKFFGLSETFDRKELKRSYSRLIKIYKPEQSPQEFQKIREAYEQLERWINSPTPPESDLFFHSLSPIETGEPPLPSGLSEDLMTLHDLVFDAGQSAEHRDGQPSKNGVPPQKQPVADSIPELLKQHSPLELFEKIYTRPQKTANDYIALAFLSDLVRHPERGQFVNWLCQGLKTAGDDPALNRLVFHYCRGKISGKKLVSVLTALSDVLPAQRLMYVTEPLWSTLLRRDFALFRTLWTTKIQPVRDLQATYIIPFLVENLSAAAWVADKDWLDDQLDYINDHFDLIQHYHEYRLSLYEILQKYLDYYEELESSGQAELLEPFEVWHHQMRQYCLASTAVEQSQFAHFQRKLATEFPAWAADFRLNKSLQYQRLLADIWEWLSHQARPGSSYRRIRPETAQAIQSARIWLLKQQFPAWLTYLQYSLSALLYLFFFFISLRLSSLIYQGVVQRLQGTSRYSPAMQDNYAAMTVFLCLAVALIATWLLGSKLGKWIRNRYYLRKIRYKAAKFYRTTQISYHQYLMAIENWLTAENSSVNSQHLIIGNQVKTDPALVIYRSTLDFQL